MLNNILLLIARVFYGTGIGTKIPIFQVVYRKMYRRSGGRTNLVIDIPLKLRLTVPNNDGGPSLELKLTGRFEPLETAIFITLVRKKDIIFDVGAHVGYYTVLAGRLVGAKGKVFSFEPVPDNINFLKKNILNNKLNNCYVIPDALSDKKGKASLFVSNTSSGDHSLKKIRDSVEIQVNTDTMDSAIVELKIVPNILKIDVEGAEGMVFMGMNKLLKNINLHTIFMELNSKGKDSNNIVSSLKREGFYIMIIDEYRKLLVEWEQSIFEKIMKSHGIVNIIAKR